MGPELQDMLCGTIICKGMWKESGAPLRVSGRGPFPMQQGQ